MTNRDFPKGFIPIRRLGGGELVTNYYDLSATNGEIFENDLVERRASGYIEQIQAGSTVGLGVAAEYKAANTGGKIAVSDADDLVMLAQVDDDTVNAQTDLDLNYDIVVGTGSALTKRSGMEIDGSSQAANANLPIKILCIAQDFTAEGNELGANVNVECVLNRGIRKAGALG